MGKCLLVKYGEVEELLDLMKTELNVPLYCPLIIFIQRCGVSRNSVCTKATVRIIQTLKIIIENVLKLAWRTDPGHPTQRLIDMDA